jgi:hypothetical protein
MVFDLLYRAGHDQTKRLLRERRADSRNSWPALNGIRSLGIEHARGLG